MLSTVGHMLVITLLVGVRTAKADASSVLRMGRGGPESSVPYYPAYDFCEQDDPLGMISGAITDSQISASSSLADGGWGTANSCAPANARPFLANGLAWCPKYKSSTEWLQIDLGVRATITGIMLQGRGIENEWVSSYTLSFSDDGIFWKFANDQYGNQRVFEGNTEAFQVKHTYLDEPRVTRFVRIHPFTWNTHPSFRLELIGCQPCKQLLGTPPYARYGASSAKNKQTGKTCNPEDGHYYSNKAWCAKRQNGMQWFQIDLGPPTLVTGVVLRSRADGKWQQFVTLFKLSYSNDSLLWFFYKDGAHLDQRVFTGNTQTLSERVHYLAAPVVARYIRIHPISWRGKIALRAGLLGCRHRGDCGHGYFRVNDKSSCIANLAYMKDAWMASNPQNPRAKQPPTVSVYAVQPHYLFLSGAGDTTSTSLVSKPTTSANSYFNSGHNSLTSSTPKPLEETQPVSPSTPINEWNMHDLMMGDAALNTRDEVALRAVDGFTGLEEGDENDDAEVEEDEKAKHEKQLDDFMNDTPYGKKPKRTHRSVSTSFSGRGGRRQCTLLKYTWPFQETPGWHVDLHEPTEVNGIVLYTGAHGKVEPYRSMIAQSLQGTPEMILQMNNLERVSVFVEGDSVPGGRQLCGQVTRTNNAVFAPKLHIACQRPIVGRYVIVEAHGLRGAWPKDYVAALCEVQVY